ETALAGLKDAHKSQNLADIDNFTDAMTKAWEAASQDMQGSASASAGPGAGSQQQQQQQAKQESTQQGNQEPQDVEFEEVK
ncbi:MAG: molecular chaperone DnaK, partial [Mucinivorans sp.]